MRHPIAATLVAAVAMLLTACQGNVFDLAVGTCFDDPGGGDEVSEVPVVECDEPHDNEVYHSFDVPDGEYPGDARITQLADEGCLAAFADWAGIQYDDSRLYYSYFVPTQASWAELDDREVLGYLYDGNLEQLTGSTEGTGV